VTEARIIDGKAFAARLREKIAASVAALKRDHGLVPSLSVVLVGDDEASQVYVRNKGRQTEEAGTISATYRLAAETLEGELLDLIADLNVDKTTHGILVKLPLPDPIDPCKDVDGFHTTNVGRLWTGLDAPVPCTPYGCLLMLKETLRELKGKRALVLGRSNIVGKPMALLLAEHCTVTIAHSRTQDLAERCREADILVAAVDRPEMVRGDWIKPGAAVIDAVGRRRGVRRGQDGRRLHHPGAGRRRTDDHRQPAAQHRHRGVPPERPPRSGALGAPPPPAFIESY